MKETTKTRKFGWLRNKFLLSNKSSVFKTKIFNQSKFLFIANLLDKAFYFIFFVILARLLTIENFGLVIAFSALVQIFFQFIELGFNIYVQRSVSRDGLKNNESVYILNSRILVASLVFLLPLLYFSESPDEVVLFVFSLALTRYFLFISELISRYYFGKNNYRKYFTYFLKGTAPKYLLLLFLFLGNLSLVLFQILVACLYLMILMKEILLIKKAEEISYSFSINFKVLRNILKVSIVMNIGLIAVTVYDRLDVIILEKLVGAESVAIYGVAYSLYKIPQMFSGPLLIPIFSRFSKQYYNKNMFEAVTINQIVKIFMLFSVLYFIIIYLFGEALILLLWGTPFLDSYSILLLLNISIPFVLFNNLTGVILNSANKEKLATTAALFSAVFGFLAYPVSIFMWGLEGAVLSTIIIEMSVFIIQLKFVINQKILKLNEIIFFKALCKT